MTATHIRQEQRRRPLVPRVRVVEPHVTFTRVSLFRERFCDLAPQMSMTRGMPSLILNLGLDSCPWVCMGMNVNHVYHPSI